MGDSYLSLKIILFIVEIVLLAIPVFMSAKLASREEEDYVGHTKK